MALDRHEMWQRAQRSGVHSLNSADLSMLGAIDLWSKAALRLGFMIMPSRPPEAVDRRGT
jgi:hypothetical protein